MLSTLNKLAKLRDGFIVVGALLYGAGLAVWSYHAWRNRIGLLPAFDMQYFIAGAVPLVVLMLACSIIMNGRHAIALAHAYLGPNATGWRIICRQSIYGIIIIGSLMMLSSLPLMKLGLVGEGTVSAVQGASSFAILLCVIFAPFPEAFYRNRTLKFLTRDRHIGLVRPFVMYYLLVVLTLTFVFLFLEKIYPRIPQEFGGIRPRAAVLDLKKEDVYSEALAELTGEVDYKQVTVRSRPVNILFCDKDRIIFRLADAGHGSTFEISRNSVKLIEWME